MTNMDHRIQGEVVHGKGEARTLGYPTANIFYTTSSAIESGVWACQMVIRGINYSGVAVVGMWVLENGFPSVEVHVLDFSQDLYGEVIEVCLLVRLRPLVKVKNVEELKECIKQDIAQTRAFIKDNFS